jgi:hypothetical protein
MWLSVLDAQVAKGTVHVLVFALQGRNGHVGRDNRILWLHK